MAGERRDYRSMSVDQMVAAGLGWEDIVVILRRRVSIEPNDWSRKTDPRDVRWYVLTRQRIKRRGK